jgi:hypothetical protein
MKHSLISQYRKMHDDAHFCGRSIYAHADRIAKLVKATGAQTILDYGSGKGRQYHEGRIQELWGGIWPTLYDPAVPGIDRRPEGTFDAVLCVDVMEHVPEDEIEETLADIRGYTRFWSYFSIACEPAKKLLPDGRNVHVTIKPQAWWLARIGDAFRDGPKAHVHFDHRKSKPPTRVKMSREWHKLGWRRTSKRP